MTRTSHHLPTRKLQYLCRCLLHFRLEGLFFRAQLIHSRLCCTRCHSRQPHVQHIAGYASWQRHHPSYRVAWPSRCEPSRVGLLNGAGHGAPPLWSACIAVARPNMHVSSRTPHTDESTYTMAPEPLHQWSGRSVSSGKLCGCFTQLRRRRRSRTCVDRQSNRHGGE